MAVEKIYDSIYKARVFLQSEGKKDICLKSKWENITTIFTVSSRIIIKSISIALYIVLYYLL